MHFDGRRVRVGRTHAGIGSVCGDVVVCRVVDQDLIALGFGLATGIIGRGKGSSFAIWFMVGAVLPLIGLIAVILFRPQGLLGRAEERTV